MAGFYQYGNELWKFLDKLSYYKHL